MLARRGAIVVNPLTSAYLDHNAKAQFYAKLAGHGVSVPRTLTTNDPDAALRFIAEIGEVVAKPQIGIGSTRLVTAEDERRIHELRYGPVMFQERVIGPTVRVHVVGDTVVLALRILNDAIDSRTETQGFEFHRLPEYACRDLARASRILGLHYCAWDVIVTGDGRYYALDCNPGPFIMWIGPEYVRVVFTELARYLLACARGAPVAEASAAVTAYRPAA
jgi:glutathione synthase/RimK-type ligase-like ATP-grasp enzyme